MSIKMVSACPHPLLCWPLDMHKSAELDGALFIRAAHRILPSMVSRTALMCEQEEHSCHSCA
jgi:hypothetical protein